MSASKTKTVLRWAGIALVSLGYYLWLGVAPVSLEYHRAMMDAVMQATGVVFDAASFGFLVCVPLILIIFHKVR